MRPLLLLALLLPLPAGAERLMGPPPGARLTVVELYTSQGCSSCPPADALLAELARTDPGVLPLGFHVTYWDRLGWKDPYSLPEATTRQRQVGAHLRLDTIYTPQLVVDGRHQAVGSDRAEVRQALAAARAAPRPDVTLAIETTPTGLHLQAGVGSGRATLLLVGFDPEHTTPVRAGENGGRTLTEVNVVRSVTPVGSWTGAPLAVDVPRPAGARAALLLQTDDGRILAAALPVATQP